jgi:hypothetical protein
MERESRVSPLHESTRLHWPLHSIPGGVNHQEGQTVGQYALRSRSRKGKAANR